MKTTYLFVAFLVTLFLSTPCIAGEETGPGVIPILDGKYALTSDAYTKYKECTSKTSLEKATQQYKDEIENCKNIASKTSGVPPWQLSSPSKDYWLLYVDKLASATKDEVAPCKSDPSKKDCDKFFKYTYKGYKAFHLNAEPGSEEILDQVKKDAASNTGWIGGKPVVNRNDDTHVVVMSFLADHLECTKNEEGFKQEDAKLVPSIFPLDTASFIGTTPAQREAFVCDLETRDKGNTKITYTVERPGNTTSSAESDVPLKADPQDRKTKPLLQGQIRVHELYRFRIIAGPVFSSLSAKNRSYSTIINAGGQSVISSSKNNDLPASLPVFLKVYLAPEGRDILEKPNSILERFSAIVGLNLVDNPLKNFYLGLSLEAFPGVDIVGGAHFAKITQLAGGFSDGQQIAAGATPPTSDKFLTGGFVGITADVGIIGSWLGSTITKSIKDGFK